MNFISALFLIINIIFISAYHIYQVPGVKGLVKSIQFDSKFNIYVTTNSNSSTIFYKINPTKTIIYQAKNLINIQKVLISKTDSIYVFDQYERFKEAIYTFTPDSTTLTKIHEYSLIASAARQTFYCKSVQLLDQSDNLYFNTGFGVGMIKANETIPRAILNLEYFWIDDDSTHAVSNDGSVFLGGSNLTTGTLIATIPTDQQKLNVPAAYIFQALDSKLNEKVSLTGMKPHPSGGVSIGVSGNQARLFSGAPYNLGILLSQYHHDYINFYSDSYSFYFFSVNLFNKECYLNYARVVDQWNIIKNPNVFESDFCYNALIVSDSVGNFFFAYGTQVFSLRKNETDVEKITFLSEPTYNISSIMVDKNDSLWIVGGDLFQVKKDSMEADQVTHSAVGIEKGLLKMYKYNEILIGTDYGLYVFSN